jgi:hypothetical protein
MEPNPINVPFPLGGVNKATGYTDQPQGTMPAALNVWPLQYPGGRRHGGVRPGLTSSGFPGATPYNWCKASWPSGDGIAVVTSAGTYVTEDGATWNLRIGTAPGSNFSTCTVLNSLLFQSSIDNAAVRVYDLEAGGSASDLEVDTYEDLSPKGEVPENCGLIYARGGRIYMAGDASSPQVLYASAINDPYDWDYSAPDEGAAWKSAGTTGHINKPIVALLEHGNGCFLVGHTDAITIIRGDPQIGGTGAIEQIDAFAGPVMQSAWCKTGNDDTVILTREELSIMRSGCGTPRVTLSRFKLPDELAAVDPANGDTASVAYDGRWGGIFIFVRRNNGEDYDYSQFYFDLAGEGFWPMEFSVGEFHLGVTMEKVLSQTRGSVIALKNGGGRYFDTTSTESISSYAWVPIEIGGPTVDGMLTRLTAVLAEDSDPVDYDIYGGMSFHEAFNSSSRRSGTWSRAGLNYSIHPRVGQNAIYVRLSGSGTDRWSVDRLLGEFFPVSGRRVTKDAP